MAVGIGEIVAGLIGYQGQREANETNLTSAREANLQSQTNAREQMDFQREMSNTAYQRSMLDMKKAGLNPMLAFSQGGASSPSGASGSAVAGKVENALTPAVSSAMDYRRMRKEVQAVESQVGLNDAVKETQASQKQLNDTNAATAKLNQEAIKAELPAIRQRAKADTIKAKYDEKLSGFDAVNTRLNTATGSIGNIMDIVRPRYKVPTRKSKETIIDKNTGEVLDERLR